MGRNCSIINTYNRVITWQEGNKLKLKDLSKTVVANVDEGSFLKAIKTKYDRILFAWKKEGQISSKRL